MSIIPTVSRPLECNHCGNRTPHSKIFDYTQEMLFDEVDEMGKLYEPYTWLGYACATCGGLNVYGSFFASEGGSQIERARLHPRGADILPPAHMVEPSQPVPPRVLAEYQEVWPMRHRVPMAFIGQVRRLLESVCKDQGATGKDLFAKLQDLATKGKLPGYFKDITSLLRRVGNMGAHAADADLSIWDAELIDDFFRSVIEYVYIAPAKIRRMETRLKVHERPGAGEASQETPPK
ncbi:hypothetical protein CLD22_14035 [Rubrivivax gelatinosus]|nr:hypothetical protein [Rubrivivax gelatinosus]